MDQDSARRIAEEVLGTVRAPAGDDLVVTDVQRIGSTWVVYWNSRIYAETREFSHALGGGEWTDPRQ
jgi:hypothetical protein